MNDPELTLVVLLWLQPGGRSEFEAFEAAASLIMGGYGGRIERRIALPQGPADQPDEVHIVSFPDEDSFTRYREDGRLVALQEQRSRAIARTTLWRGSQLGGWPDEGETQRYRPPGSVGIGPMNDSTPTLEHY